MLVKSNRDQVKSFNFFGSSHQVKRLAHPYLSLSTVCSLTMEVILLDTITPSESLHTCMEAPTWPGGRMGSHSIKLFLDVTSVEPLGLK